MKITAWIVGSIKCLPWGIKPQQNSVDWNWTIACGAPCRGFVFGVEKTWKILLLHHKINDSEGPNYCILQCFIFTSKFRNYGESTAVSTTQDRVNTVPYVFVPFFYGVIVSCQLSHTHKQLIAWLHRPSKRLLSYYWHIDLRCTTSVYRDCRKTTLLNKKMFTYGFPFQKPSSNFTGDILQWSW